jgi:hypothetical protein
MSVEGASKLPRRAERANLGNPEQAGWSLDNVAVITK